VFYACGALQIAIGVITLDAAGNQLGVEHGLAEWGIGLMTWKWMSLINPIITGLAGKQGMSWASLARNQDGGEK
jgi:hypothetical protein